MNYTQNEILAIQKNIAGTNVPIIMEITSKNSIILKYKYDEEINAKFTKMFQFEAISKLPNGNYYSFADAQLDNFLFKIKQWIRVIKAEHPTELNRVEFIETFSLKFYNVFQEAININCIGYTESAGMIYRKALEILIKDYLIKILPDCTEIILNETIGKIVFIFYDVQEDNLTVRQKINHKKKKINSDQLSAQLNEILPFISFVNKTFQIGNDFSHYERKLETHTTQDLENNINQIIEYVKIQAEKESHQNKINSINSSFQNFKINK